MTNEIGPRAASDVAYERAMSAYRNALQARLAGEDGSKYSEVAHEQTRRFEEAAKVAIPERPTRGWMGLMCRGLGELLDVPKPTREEFPEARRYRVLPYLTLLIPIGLIFFMVTVLPWTALSPVTATGRAIGGDEGQMVAGQITTLVLSLVVVAFFFIVGPKKVKTFLFDAALQEELWFRLGAEAWSPGRRVRACIQFGIAHLLNLVVAVATLGGLALVGGVYMWVYLREFRATGDPRQAVVVSAQFHATYNWGAVMLMFAMAALVLATYVIPLFL